MARVRCPGERRIRAAVAMDDRGDGRVHPADRGAGRPAAVRRPRRRDAAAGHLCGHRRWFGARRHRRLRGGAARGRHVAGDAGDLGVDLRRGRMGCGLGQRGGPVDHPRDVGAVHRGGQRAGCAALRAAVGVAGTTLIERSTPGADRRYRRTAQRGAEPAGGDLQPGARPGAAVAGAAHGIRCRGCADEPAGHRRPAVVPADVRPAAAVGRLPDAGGRQGLLRFAAR